MTYKILENNYCSYELDGVTYELSPSFVNNVLILLTEEEALQRATEQKEEDSKSADNKLERIKEFRREKLEETDWMSNSDVTMPDSIKTWRQTLRDIPQTYTTEAEYDLLLARTDGKLTHSIWTKP